MKMLKKCVVYRWETNRSESKENKREKKKIHFFISKSHLCVLQAHAVMCS